MFTSNSLKGNYNQNELKYKFHFTEHQKNLLTYIKGTYIILPNRTIDVQGSINISNLNLHKIPFKFNKVSGNFSCTRNQLTSLEGCPSKVGGDFYCFRNQLTSLKGCPREVGGDFYCSGNTELWDINNIPKCKEFFYDKEIVQKNQLKRLNPDQVPFKDLEKYKEAITELF